MNYAAADARSCPVIELRQYTLKPGQRDTLIDLFDRHFVESQEAVGMTIIGQFREENERRGEKQGYSLSPFLLFVSGR
jgi:hypothetical protein